VPYIPRNIPSPTADRGQYPIKPIATERGDTLVRNEERPSSGGMKSERQRVVDQEDFVVPRLVENRNDCVEFTSRADNECRELYRKVNPLAQDKEGQC
jgi:hypothetical protein